MCGTEIGQFNPDYAACARIRSQPDPAPQGLSRSICLHAEIRDKKPHLQYILRQEFDFSSLISACRHLLCDVRYARTVCPIPSTHILYGAACLCTLYPICGRPILYGSSCLSWGILYGASCLYLLRDVQSATDIAYGAIRPRACYMRCAVLRQRLALVRARGARALY